MTATYRILYKDESFEFIEGVVGISFSEEGAKMYFDRLLDVVVVSIRDIEEIELTVASNMEEEW